MTNLETEPMQVTSAPLPVLAGAELKHCMDFINGNGPAQSFCEFEFVYIDLDGDGKYDLLEAKVRVKVPEPCFE